MPGTKPPPFFCPLCGQKHRADLTPLLKRPGLSLRTRCQGCDAPLSIQMEGGKPVAKATGTPTPPPTPDIGGPYEKDVELAPGDRAGRYEIEALLQRGHTSTIYRAHDPETKRTVALKVLGAQADAEAKARFERQIEVQGRIRHPNVLPVYDRGALADGRPFFAAELLHDPQTLDGLVGRMRSGAIGPDDPLAAMGDVAGLVRDVLLPIADGISVANVENGEIHRDLRPGNVLVDGQSGRPYVTDFSLAAPPSDTEKARPVPLTPYVAPETTQDRVHPRTDVWGLGALLVLVLSGEPPLEGRGRPLLDAARKGRVRAFPAGAPPALAAIARKALAPSPDSRYVNARQMAADLRAWVRGGTVRAVEEFGDQAAQRIELRETLVRGGKLALWAVGGLLVGLLVGSRIRLAGGQPGRLGIEAAARDADLLDREITALAQQVAGLDVDEGARVWKTLTDRLDEVVRRTDRHAHGDDAGGDGGVHARAAYTRRRLLVSPLDLSLPDGLPLHAENLSLGESVDLPASPRGPVVVPPGRYEIGDAEGRVRFPLDLPLDIVPPGQTRGATPLSLTIPPQAAHPPEGTVFVMGGRLSAGREPWATPSAPTHVAPFFLDRRPVTSEEWQAFLTTLDESARATLGEVPASDDPSAPVRVRPAQAEAWCRWRSATEHRAVRLSTTAEWSLAAGGTLLGKTEPVSLPDTPYGIEGLGRPPRELATAPDGSTVFVGAAADEGPWTRVFGRAPIPDDGRAAFRCARPLR